MSPSKRRRGRLTRLDDALLGKPGTRHGFFGDLVLGIHPWLRPLDLLIVLVGIILLIFGLVRRDGGLAIIGAGWVFGGLLYLYVSRGKPARPPGNDAGGER